MHCVQHDVNSWIFKRNLNSQGRWEQELQCRVLLFSRNGLYVGCTSVLLSSAGPQEPIAVEPGMNQLQPPARATWRWNYWVPSSCTYFYKSRACDGMCISTNGFPSGRYSGAYARTLRTSFLHRPERGDAGVLSEHWKQGQRERYIVLIILC